MCMCVAYVSSTLINPEFKLFLSLQDVIKYFLLLCGNEIVLIRMCQKHLKDIATEVQDYEKLTLIKTTHID